MKCEYCGAEIVSDVEKCPYCNNINPVGVEFQNKILQNKQSNESLKKNVIEQNKESIANKILSRAIAVTLILLLLNIIGGTYASQLSDGEIKKLETPKKSEQTMDLFVNNKEYSKLYIYMDKQDLLSEKYYTYSQLSLLQADYIHFTEYRNECINQIEKDGLPDKSNLSFAIRYASDILDPYIYAYPDIQPESAILLKEQEKSVTAFFKDYLKLNEKELSSILNSKNQFLDSDELATTILQRNSGGFTNEK